MIPKAVDSLDFVEAVMVLEEVLGIEIPDAEAEHFGSPRETVDCLERYLSSQRPNKQAATLIKRLAKTQNNPPLAEGLVPVATRADCRCGSGSLPSS